MSLYSTDFQLQRIFKKICKVFIFNLLNNVFQGVTCGPGEVCQMVDIPCVDGVCPPIPQCVPVLQSGKVPSCPVGEAYTLLEANATLACSPRARALECPQGYSCFADESTLEGVCCPTPSK